MASEIIVDVACGSCHTCALTSTGLMYEFGNRSSSDEGSSTTSNNPFLALPRLLPNLSSSSKGFVITCVSAGSDFTSCITTTGEVFTWGNGELGKLGHGCESNQNTPKLVEALAGIEAKQVACGLYHTVVCTGNGHVYTFGDDEHGQLGHHRQQGNKRTSPELVQALVGKHIIQVQCNFFHTMALTSSGYVFAWGSAPPKGT